MTYAILRKPGTVAHLTREKFGMPLCGRAATMTSNFPGGRRCCKDCLARSAGEGI